MHGTHRDRGRTRLPDPPGLDAPSRHDDDSLMSHRKLIRPNLSELKDRLPKSFGQRRPTPQAETNAESFYYLKQMNSHTPMVVVLLDGEQLRGWIEWYDRSCIKVNRDDGPNLLVMKHQIKYIHKQEEDGRRGRDSV